MINQNYLVYLHKKLLLTSILRKQTGTNGEWKVKYLDFLEMCCLCSLLLVPQEFKSTILWPAAFLEDVYISWVSFWSHQLQIKSSAGPNNTQFLHHCSTNSSKEWGGQAIEYTKTHLKGFHLQWDKLILLFLWAGVPIYSTFGMSQAGI